MSAGPSFVLPATPMWQPRRWLLAVAVAALLLPATSTAVANGAVSIRLGFLTPYPNIDSAVPLELREEWVSAFRVALEYFGVQFGSTFVIEPFVQNSDCNAIAAGAAAERLVRAGVVGVIGPACSEAATGAAYVLGQYGIPMVSFAATADALSNRELYPTFFRTVYNDTAQARAIMAVTDFFKWQKLYIMYSEETYGLGLASSVALAAAQSNPPIEVEGIGVSVEVPAEGYGPLFQRITPSQTTMILIITTPKIAQNLYTAAQALGYLDYPWWFFGTDGATAFDLIGAGEDKQALALAMQGEIGLKPFEGNFGSPNLERLINHWQLESYQSYPGLLTLDVTPKYDRPRAYVVYLWDAVYSFYLAINNTIHEGLEVSTASLFDRYNTGGIYFSGCSGTVHWPAGSGERDTMVDFGYGYEFVSLKGTLYQSVATWTSENPTSFFIINGTLSRPSSGNGVSAAPTVYDTTNGTVIVSDAPESADVVPVAALAPTTVFSETPEFSGTAYAPGSLPESEPVLGIPEAAIAPSTGISPPPVAKVTYPPDATPSPPYTPPYIEDLTIDSPSMATPTSPATGTSPSATASSSSASTKTSSGGLSGGAIAGIVIPIAILLIGGGAFAYYVYVSRAKESQFVRML